MDDFGDLEQAGIRYVRLILVDYSNIIRARIMPIKKFLELVSTNPEPDDPPRGLCMASVNATLPMFADVLVEELASTYPFLSAVGEFVLVPDRETLRKPYEPGAHAICHGTLQAKMDIPGRIGRELDFCPRTCLRRIMRQAAESGISFLVGFETEVIFLSSTDPITPVDKMAYMRTAAFSNVKVAQMMDEIAAGLEAQKIGVIQFHKESAPGQYEFSTVPQDPLQAAHTVVLTRETIFNIAAKYGIKATFAPKVFMDSTGSASHCHISIHTADNLGPASNTSGVPPGLSALEESFMAGILKHLRAVAAFTMASTNSYARLQEGHFAGVHIAYGVDNRETPLRVTYPPSSKNSRRDYRFEIKCFDATANPYLGLAAILTAGFHNGIKKGLKLTSENLQVDPATLSVEERQARGVTERLPASLAEAIDALETDSKFFFEGMTETVVNVYKRLKKAEVAHMNNLDALDQLKLIVENY